MKAADSHVHRPRAACARGRHRPARLAHGRGPAGPPRRGRAPLPGSHGQGTAEGASAAAGPCLLTFHQRIVSRVRRGKSEPNAPLPWLLRRRRRLEKRAGPTASSAPLAPPRPARPAPRRRTGRWTRAACLGSVLPTKVKAFKRTYLSRITPCYKYYLHLI